MCVMDFAFDFQPLNAENEMKVQMNKEDMMNNSNFANQNNNPNNQSPLVNINVDNEDFKNKDMNINPQLYQNNQNPVMIQSNQGGNNEVDQIILNTTNVMNSLKVLSKKVEIVTKVTYTYEDGSTKVVTQNETHEFKG